MFLVRSAFWLSVVILLLPAEEKPKNAELSKVQEKITAGQALVAAQSTMDDVSGFCLRNQTACDTGKAAVSIFVRKAQYGAKLLNEWVGGVSTANAAQLAPAQHSSIDTNVKYGRLIRLAGNNQPSQQTLTKDDLRPAWGGPAIKTKT